MNFLGVGLPEMLLIFVVALLVFGPRKLPEISKKLAKTVKSLQEASREFETALNREAVELEKSTRKVTNSRVGALNRKPKVTEGIPETSTDPTEVVAEAEVATESVEGDLIASTETAETTGDPVADTVSTSESEPVVAEQNSSDPSEDSETAEAA